MWSSNQGSAFISSIQPWEIRHSAWISWSSKTIVIGTVENSQRMRGSDHASLYASAYSAKSASSSSGTPEGRGRPARASCSCGDGSSA